MKTLSLMCISLFTAVLAFSQTVPDSLWSQTYGFNNHDAHYCVRPTSDGGFISAGHTYSGSWANFWMVKTNADGSTAWNRSFPENYSQGARSVQETSDGGFIAAGFTQNRGVGTPTYTNVWLMKTDADGDTLWTNTFGGADHDRAFCVRQTSDGGYIVAGNTASYGMGGNDFYLIKTDANGDSLWTKTYGGEGTEICYCVEETSDGGYILGGYTTSFGGGGNDVWLVKTNASGDSVWSDDIGGTGSEVCYGVTEGPDGFYGCGTTDSEYPSKQFYLTLTTPAGLTAVQSNWGGAGDDFLRSIELLGDNSFLLGGVTNSYGSGGQDYTLLRASRYLQVIWQDYYGGNGDEDCWFASKCTHAPGYIMTGWTETWGSGLKDAWIVRVVEYGFDSITDVGNDQGRQVRLTWYRNAYDSSVPYYTITGYALYRRIDAYLVDNPNRPPANNLDWPPGDWEYIQTVPAFGERDYSVIAPTLADSSSDGIYWSSFFIRAMTPDPLVFFDTAADSGYSVDNLPPDVTVLTAGLSVIGSNLELRWEEVTTGGGGQPEHNNIWYHVYGDTESNFTPGETNHLTATQGLSYSHPITEDQFYFKVLVSNSP
ncbi:hypothetical protein KKC97_10195 [bacterium]|nr:hypothetical protein [bacterium]